MFGIPTPTTIYNNAYSCQLNYVHGDLLVTSLSQQIEYFCKKKKLSIFELTYFLTYENSLRK